MEKVLHIGKILIKLWLNEIEDEAIKMSPYRCGEPVNI